MKYTPAMLRIGINNAQVAIVYLTALDNEKFHDLIHRQIIKAERYQKMLDATKWNLYLYNQ